MVLFVRGHVCRDADAVTGDVAGRKARVRAGGYATMTRGDGPR